MNPILFYIIVIVAGLFVFIVAMNMRGKK